MSAISTSVKGVPEALSALGNACKRSKGNKNTPEVIEARRVLAEAKLAQYIQLTVSQAPELGPDARARLAQLLAPVGVTTR